METRLLKKYGLTLLGTLLGGVGGFLYWKFVGCASGTCPITASPMGSIVWGAITGGLLLGMFNKPSK